MAESRPLLIEAAMLDQIVAHLRAGLPNEACGLLAGVDAGAQDRAMHFFPGTNIDASPVRYTMAPAEVIEAMKRMRTEGWELAAIVHSHPRTAPEPSPTDRREWYYPDARLLIVSFAGESPEIGCWGLVGDPESREIRATPLVIGGR